LLFWQAGAIFSAGKQVSRHASASSARSRIDSAKENTQSAVHESKNFARGVQGKPAVQQNGQAVLDSGDSRAHAKGAQLNNAHQSVSTRLSQSADSTDGQSSQSTTGTDSTESESRQTDFSNLRDQDTSSAPEPIDPHESDDTDRPASIY
jgi:uncharacterized phage infection (PIP) family protein YhgE